MSLILSGTDGLSDVDGSAATPAIRGTDANTGIFFPAADTIAFSEGGAEIARFDSSGNLLVGTATTSTLSGYTVVGQFKNSIGIVNSSADEFSGALLRESSGSNSISLNADPANLRAGSYLGFGVDGSERARIDSSGNVGIGNTSPSSYNGVADNLVIGTSGSTGLTIVSGTSNDGSIHFADGTSGADAYRGQIYYAHNGNYMVFGTDGTERLRIDSSGSLTLAGAGFMYFGNSSQFIRSAGAGGAQMIVGAASGGFYQQVGATYYLVTTAGGSTSDETLKKNIQPIQNALSKVCAITGITYEFIEEPMCDADKGAQIGVGAQTVETQFPEIVVTQEDGKKTVRYDRLVAPLIEAIKEQQALITQLQADVAVLKGTS
jgi:hypothetical protein